MRATRITRWAAVAAVVTAQGLHAQGAPPAQAAAAPAAADAQPPSVCGNTANCVETNDFAAVITNFRTSDLRGYKMIDVVMHFVNKTPKSLVLGYVQNSGTIIDDKGNRYVVWGANGVRGMGQVYGGSFDPKFALDGGGSGDAQFELAWYPGQQIYGFNFAFDLAIDEINSYEGGQHSLGGEFPLHFQGLTNGIASNGQVAAVGGGAGGGGGGGGAAGGQPCNNGGAAGTAQAVANATGSQAAQGAAAQGAATVAQATTAVQNLTSLFSKKKSQPNKPATNPCGSASGTVTQSAAGSVASPTAAAGGASQAPASASTTATPARATTSTDPAAMKAGGVRPGTTPSVTQPTTKTATPATTTTPPKPAPRTGNKKTVTPDTTTKHP